VPNARSLRLHSRLTAVGATAAICGFTTIRPGLQQ
jgi:hypothetical protein